MEFITSVRSEAGDCPLEPDDGCWVEQKQCERVAFYAFRRPQEKSIFDHCSVYLSPHVKALLLENDAKRWAIELGGFLTNHLWHGILALAGLGASDALIDRFVFEYSKRLEPAQDRHDLPEEAPRSPRSHHGLSLGAREEFMQHIRAFEREVDAGSFLADATHESASHVPGMIAP